MSKSSIGRLFIGAALAVVIGLVVALVAVIVAILNGAVSIGGPETFTINGDALGGMVVWMVVAGLLMGGGTIAAIISWVGALFNTAQLEDKTWFIVLLVLGLASFGWIAMIAYVVAGPDGTARRSASPDITSTVVGG